MCAPVGLSFLSSVPSLEKLSTVGPSTVAFGTPREGLGKKDQEDRSYRREGAEPKVAFRDCSPRRANGVVAIGSSADELTRRTPRVDDT